jgi:F-type H+-transporting ATPase subunit delta
MSTEHKTLHASPLAHNYARAVLELAGDQDAAVGQELTALAELVEANASFKQFLTDPSVLTEERTALVNKTLGGKISPVVLHLLGVMGEKHRLGQLSEVAEAYSQQLDAKRGAIDVEVTTAGALSGPDLAGVTTAISAALGKEARVTPHVDAGLIGGLVLRIGDRVIDGSVRAQLSDVRKKLLAAKPTAR